MPTASLRLCPHQFEKKKVFLQFERLPKEWAFALFNSSERYLTCQAALHAPFYLGPGSSLRD
jgi:hypothetical protein